MLIRKEYSGLYYYPVERIAETNFGGQELTVIQGKIMDRLISSPEQTVLFDTLFGCWEEDYSGAFDDLKVHISYLRNNLRILYKQGGVDLSPYPIPVSVKRKGYTLSNRYDLETLKRLPNIIC